VCTAEFAGQGIGHDDGNVVALGADAVRTQALQGAACHIEREPVRHVRAIECRLRHAKTRAIELVAFEQAGFDRVDAVGAVIGIIAGEQAFGGDGTKTTPAVKHSVPELLRATPFRELACHRDNRYTNRHRSL
jgi:hypothetical protein